MEKMPGGSYNIPDIPHLCRKPAFLPVPWPFSSLPPQSSAPNKWPQVQLPAFLILPTCFPLEISFSLPLICCQTMYFTSYTTAVIPISGMHKTWDWPVRIYSVHQSFQPKVWYLGPQRETHTGVFWDAENDLYLHYLVMMRVYTMLKFVGWYI